MPDLYETIVELRRRGEPGALCTVIGTHGSTPGKECMKMLVHCDGRTLGSVGGGRLESEVRAAALEVLAAGKSRTLAFAMDASEYTPGAMICGGKLEVFIEPTTEPTLVIFGAGHVSRALCVIARTAGFRVLVGDDREEFATAERFPLAAEVASAPWEDLVARFAPSEHTYVLVVTRGHADDGEVLAALAARAAQPRYLGMIGSRRKRATLFAELERRGVERDWLGNIDSPAGLAIGAQLHGEIAVSIAARLIALRRGGAEPFAGTS